MAIIKNCGFMWAAMKQGFTTKITKNTKRPENFHGAGAHGEGRDFRYGKILRVICDLCGKSFCLGWRDAQVVG